MNKSKVAVAVSRMISLIQMAAGIFLLVVFGISTLALFDASFRASTDVSFFIVCGVADALGILLIVLSRKRSKLIKEFKKYVSYISDDPSGSIANIAASMGTSPDVVKRNLELMIKNNYFANARINQQDNTIVIGTNENQYRAQQMGQSAAEEQKEAKTSMVPVTCKCCGGMNKIAKGAVAECDFCGSPIRG